MTNPYQELLGTVINLRKHNTALRHQITTAAAKVGIVGEAEEIIEKVVAEVKRLRDCLDRAGLQCFMGQEPDTCLIDDGDPDGCCVARKLLTTGKGRDDCEYWKPKPVQ